MRAESDERRSAHAPAAAAARDREVASERAAPAPPGRSVVSVAVPWCMDGKMDADVIKVMIYICANVHAML